MPFREQVSGGTMTLVPEGREQRFHSGRLWRQQPTVVLGLLILLALVGCAPFGSSSASPKTLDQQLGLTPGTLGTGDTPAGWRRLLNGQSFTDSTGENSIAATPARPGRLAACALPAGVTHGRPVFLLSDNGGSAWQSRAIPDVGAHWQTCLTLADAQLANTFAVEVGEAGGSNGGVSLVELTTNAGQTWRVLPPPSGYQVTVYAQGETTLVDGTLYADLRSSSLTQDEFARLTPDGVWHNLNNTLPFVHAPAGQNQEPSAVTVDPTNADRVLIAQPTAHGVTTFLSNDAGTSWRAVTSWPTSLKVALWPGPAQRFYAQDVVDSASTSAQFFYSRDGGVTWVGDGLHTHGAYSSVDRVFVSSGGRVLTAWDGQFFTLDPATGVFATLSAAPTFDSGVFTCIISEGASPTVICAGQSDTFARSLPSFTIR